MSEEIASFEGNISDLIVQPDYVWHNGEWRDVTTAKIIDVLAEAASLRIRESLSRQRAIYDQE